MSAQLGSGGMVAMPTEREDTEKSLAIMLKAHFISKELNDVYAATELRENEVPALASLLTARFVSFVMATQQADIDNAAPGVQEKVKARVELKTKMLADTNAMAFVCED